MNITASCPHLHETPVDLLFDETSEKLSLWACTNGDRACHHPVVKCPHAKCGAYNRTTARACTRCQKPFDLKKIERDFLSNLAFQNDPPLSHTVPFDKEAHSVTELFAALGYLFVRTKKAGLSIFNAYHPSKPLYNIPAEEEEDDEPARIAFVEATKEGEKLHPPYALISTPRRVWRFDFLPEFLPSEVATAPTGTAFHFQPLVANQGLLHFIYKKDTHRLALWMSRGGDLVWEEGTQLGLPVETAEGKVIFYSPHEVYIYDSRSGRLLSPIKASSELDVANNAVYNPSQNEVFIPGKGNLHRLNLQEDSPRLVPLGVKIAGFFKTGASSDDAEVYIGDENELTICNSFTGQVNWNSYRLLFQKKPYNLFPPRPFGPALLFVYSMQTRQRAGLLDLRSKRRVFQIDFGEKTLHVPPLLCANRIICATSDSNDCPELKVFQLT